MAKILLVEDDEAVRDSISDVLTFDQHRVETCSNGADAIQLLSYNKYDLLILDWQLPGKTGVEICKHVREQGDTTPILMLTGRAHIDDKEMGFQAGTDDYLTKPFHLTELRLRVTSLTKRANAVTTDRVVYKGLEIDSRAHQAWIDGVETSLLPLEFALLELFMKNPDTAFTAEALMARVWTSDAEPSVAGLRQCLARLRKKLGDKYSGAIQNIYGVGYKFSIED